MPPCWLTFGKRCLVVEMPNPGHKGAPNENRGVGRNGGIFKKCVNSQAVYLLSEQHGLEAQERR